MRPTDRVLIYADTCPEWLITALACFKSSIAIVTLYTNLGEDAVVYGINQVEVEVLFTRYSSVHINEFQSTSYDVFIEGPPLPKK